MAEREKHPAETPVRDEELRVREEQAEVDEVFDQHVLVRKPGPQRLGADTAGHDDDEPVTAGERLDRRDHELARIVVVDSPLRDTTTTRPDHSTIRGSRGAVGAARCGSSAPTHSAFGGT